MSAMRQENDATADRAIGALLGLACGDAVGTALEFKRPGTFTPIDDMVGGGPFGLKAGEWTDDTSLALCLAESILDRGDLDPSDQLRRYVLWQTQGYLSSNGRCFDIGNATARQLARFQQTGEPYDPNPSQEAAANGSLMRLAPVPIRWHEDPAEAAQRSAESSRTTHPAERPVDTCRVLGALTSALINGAPARDVFSEAFWQFGTLHPEVEAIVRGSWHTKQPPEIRGTGYCVHALEAALWAVDAARNFCEAILRAANLGDDADTTAAIAGQLAGARWGASAIPKAWRQRVVSSERICSLAFQLYARRVVCPWPLDDFLHAWWVDPGAVLAGEYPGDVEPRRAMDKVNSLIDAGIRAFIDLTTPADRLAPYDHLVGAASKARQLDLRWHQFPIPDLGTASREVYEDISALIREERKRGGVYVHCWGGVGRTGTVVGHLLADAGLSYARVMQALRDLRRGTKKAEKPCPETDAQRAVLREKCARARK